MLDGIKAVLFDLDGTLVDSMWMWGAIDVEYLGRHGLEGAGIEQGGGLVLHVRAHVVPGLGHLVLFQVDLVGNVVLFGCHSAFSFHNS